MKKQEKPRKLFKEVFNILSKLFEKCELPDKILDIPEDVKKLGLRLNLLSYIMTVISLVFSFLIKLSNSLITKHFILWGIIFFMLYKGQDVIREAYRLFKKTEDEKFDLIFDNAVSMKGSQIIGQTSNKVLKYDDKSGIYKTMSNESVINSIRNYLTSIWIRKITAIFYFLEIISVIVMLIVAISTNDSIPNTIFVPMLIAFSMISFVNSAYISINRSDYFEKYKELRNEQSVISNDLLRCPLIVQNDLDMRIEKFKESIKSSNANLISFNRKSNKARLIVTIIETLCQYGIIIAFLANVEWNSITLATIANITATLTIVNSGLGHIGHIASILDNNASRFVTIEKEEPDVKLILNVYHCELEKKLNSKSKIIDNINISPFSVQYLEESDNDKPFTLTCEQNINIANGEILILYGPSGSGKSTFMKLLTERIRVEKSTNIPATNRYMFFDEKLRFGSLNIYDELFCCKENPDLDKMKNILENLHLWQELSANCYDIWTWMQQKKFDETLSNGQKQRLILGKMLYWLDDSIDVLVLDECTSGLDSHSDSDSADAERILEYIVRYANNKDKNRIIIISTHQDIDNFKEKLANEFQFKNLMFTKHGEQNLICEF